MQLVVNVKNEALANKIIKILEVFKNEGVEIKKIMMPKEKWSDGYLEYNEKYSDFFKFLKKVYSGQENISNLSDEEVLEDALRDKYGL